VSSQEEIPNICAPWVEAAMCHVCESKMGDVGYLNESNHVEVEPIMVVLSLTFSDVK
jgi:hypothetical protein